MLPIENYSICDRCGKPYLNFCVSCAKVNREEMVEELMDKFGLTVEELIRTLALEVTKEDVNFGALRLAIEMRSMKPATKTDVTSGGQPLAIDQNVKDRLLNKISKVVKPESAD